MHAFHAYGESEAVGSTDLERWLRVLREDQIGANGQVRNRGVVQDEIRIKHSKIALKHLVLVLAA